MIGGDGLILTIGYLILEADEILVTDQSGNGAASFVAYDHESGFGLVRTPTEIDAAPVGLGFYLGRRGRHGSCRRHRLRPGDVRSLIVSRRPRRELGLPSRWAVFTSPPIRHFGGAGLFADDGRLVGIGSLIVSDAAGTGEGAHGNMFVPIGLLKPILADLLAFGASTSPANPWLGLYPQETGGVLVVGRVADGGPAGRAGLSGETSSCRLAPVRCARWTISTGRSGRSATGVAVPLRVLTGDAIRDVRIKHGSHRG